MTPAEKILQKRLSTLGLSTEEWDRVSTAIKDRAFFSSRVTSADFLKTCQTRIAELLSNATNAEGVITSRAQIVSDIMEAAAVAGINTGTASLSNPGSEARATQAGTKGTAHSSSRAPAPPANRRPCPRKAP